MTSYTEVFRTEDPNNPTTMLTTIDRHHFGDESDWIEQIDDVEDKIKVGTKKTYTFETPNIVQSRSLRAVLMFQTIDVNSNKNIMYINGNQVPNAIRRTNNSVDNNRPDFDWHGNVVLIPQSWFNPVGDNTMEIQSRNKDGDPEPDFEDFIIDDVVLFYKSENNRGDDGSVLRVTATAELQNKSL